MLFDKKQLLDEIGGDDEIVKMVLDGAALEIQREMDKLVVCCAGSDTEVIRRQAHGVKSIAAGIFAPALQEISAKVESAAEDGDLEHARGLLPDLGRVAQMTIQALHL